MSEVRKLSKTELIDFTTIVSNAYPSFSVYSKEEKEKMSERFSFIQEKIVNENFYGLFRDNKLLGGMLLHDFKMNYMDTMIECGGVGMVAVDLIHKKEKVAKELVEFYLNHYINKDVNLAVLYPFRLDFYKSMGFGYGTKMNQYKIKPSAFKKSDLKKNVCYLNEEDKEDIRNCYNDFVNDNHGMIEMGEYDYQGMFKNPKVKALGYKVNNKLEGYVLYTFKSDKDNFLINDMIIQKLIYNSRDALVGLLAFFQTQIDQIRYVVTHTQDDSFHHLLKDPTNGSNHIIPHVYHESNVQGVGLMYRIINLEGFFRDVKNNNFNNINITMKLSIDDDFILINNQKLIVEFRDGFVNINNNNNYDVEIKMNIAEFSSLVMGVVNFKTLYNYSLADVSNIELVDKINLLFETKVKPICMTGF